MKNKRKAHNGVEEENNTKVMANSIKEVFNDLGYVGPQVENKDKASLQKTSIKDSTIPEFFAMIKSHSDYLKLLQSNNICSVEERDDILNKIKKIYEMIKKQSGHNKRTIDGDETDGTNTAS